MNGNEAHENRVSFLSINVCLLLGFCGFLITKRMEVLGFVYIFFNKFVFTDFPLLRKERGCCCIYPAHFLILFWKFRDLCVTISAIEPRFILNCLLVKRQF